MPIIKKKTPDAPLSSAELFCNMTGGMAFRIVEMYKNIRTSLLFTLAGKSVTTANLSLSFSQTGAKVLIIDCDMRNPSQQKLFAQANAQGLSNVLSNMCAFEDVVKHNVYENLDLLTAGQTPPNPSELLGSNSMKALLEKVKGMYDFVFLDSPPVELVSDTASLLLNVPQAIVIARQNHAVYPEVIHTVDVIKSVGGKILGAVLTDVKETDKSYSYATGVYSRYGRYGRYGKYGHYGHYGHYGYGSHTSGYYSGGYNRSSNNYGYGYGKSAHGGKFFGTQKQSKATQETNKETMSYGESYGKKHKKDKKD